MLDGLQMKNNQRRPSGSSSSAELPMPTKTSSNAASAVRSSCKTMQRKLEQKVERTRNLLTHKLPPQSADSSLDPKNPPLMPVSRMRIPGQADCLPLVDYRDDKHTRSGDIDDNEDDVDFYPIPKKSSANKQTELSDTFSLHEMTICDSDEDDEDATNVDTRTGAIFDDDDDEDDDDSQTLEFLSPKLVRGRSWKDSCSQLFCCGNSLRL